MEHFAITQEEECHSWVLILQALNTAMFLLIYELCLHCEAGFLLHTKLE